MSYKKPESSGDLLYDFFVQAAEFYNVLPNLQNATSMEALINWFEKLVQIDTRATYIHLCKNYDHYDKEFLKYAERRLRLPVKPSNDGEETYELERLSKGEGYE